MYGHCLCVPKPDGSDCEYMEDEDPSVSAATMATELAETVMAIKAGEAPVF